MANNKKKIKPIDVPAYSYWSALYMSFYSKHLYIDVGKRWRGIGLIYLFLVVALGSIPYSLNMIAEFNKDFNQQLIEPLLQLPDVYVQNGQVSFDKPMPYFIKNDKGQVQIIIDTTGKVTKFSEQYPALTMLINKDRISIRLPVPSIMDIADVPNNKGPSIVQSFDQGTNMMFNGKELVKNNSMYGLKYASQFVIYPLVVVFIYSLLVVFFLVLAFLGQVFARIFFSFKLEFKKSCRLFMVASTPMVLVLLMFLTFNLIFFGFGIILLILIGAYFSFAVHSLRSESKRMVS